MDTKNFFADLKLVFNNGDIEGIKRIISARKLFYAKFPVDQKLNMMAVDGEIYLNLLLHENILNNIDEILNLIPLFIKSIMINQLRSAIRLNVSLAKFGSINEQLLNLVEKLILLAGFMPAFGELKSDLIILARMIKYPQFFNSSNFKKYLTKLTKVIELKYINPEIWPTLIEMIYIPSFASNPLLKELAIDFPNLDIDSAFVYPVNTLDDAVTYLTDLVSKKYEPGGIKSKESLDRLHIASGQTIEVNRDYTELIDEINRKLNTASMTQVCSVIAQFKDRLDLDLRCEDYEIKDLIDVIRQLAEILPKMQLVKLVNLL
jgi:hypothetical protein